MKLTQLLAAGLLGAVALASDAPRGTVPRAAAENYDAHTEQNGLAIGASLLTAAQARKAFTTEVDRCCLVVEVALYPPKDGLAEIAGRNFALRIAGKDIAARPSSAELVAAKLQRHTEPQPDGRDVVISPTAGIGYQTGGVDPNTGQPRSGGVTRSAGVGVGIGGPQPPKAGSTDADLHTMEMELHEKGLPEGNTSAPVSGYLYFALPQKRKTKYQLEYTLSSTKITLDLR